MSLDDVARAQSRHFSGLFEKYGNTPRGVSSESLAHKNARYREILSCLDVQENFSLHDVGFGLGAFNDFLVVSLPGNNFEYSGSEVTSSYIDAVRKRIPGKLFFLRNLADGQASDYVDEQYDFVTLSGVFHQIQDTNILDWENYMKAILSNSFSLTKKIMVFNLVSPFVAWRNPGVYYADITKILEFIQGSLSRFFLVRHNYALFEFTVAVYTETYIKTKSPEPEFQKYFGT
jgi:hypothetical protein